MSVIDWLWRSIKEKGFLYRRMPANKYTKEDRFRKSPFCTSQFNTESGRDRRWMLKALRERLWGIEYSHSLKINFLYQITY